MEMRKMDNGTDEGGYSKNDDMGQEGREEEEKVEREIVRV